MKTIWLFFFGNMDLFPRCGLFGTACPKSHWGAIRAGDGKSDWDASCICYTHSDLDLRSCVHFSHAFKVNFSKVHGLAECSELRANCFEHGISCLQMCSYGFVRFDSVIAARAAIMALDQTSVEGYPLQVKFADADAGLPAPGAASGLTPSDSCYVKHLPPAVTVRKYETNLSFVAASYIGCIAQRIFVSHPSPLKWSAFFRLLVSSLK